MVQGVFQVWNLEAFTGVAFEWVVDITPSTLVAHEQRGSSFILAPT